MPQSTELSRIEGEALVARVNAVRQAITHAGEKGRSLESEVTKVLRSFLPAEYGLSTGFVAYCALDGTVKLSQQLDIIIYDALRGGALARLGTCDVFPLESVYGYVEVKAVLGSTSDDAKKFAGNSIEDIIERNAKIREEMRLRQFYVVRKGTITGALAWPAPGTQWTPLRSFVFAFEASGTIGSDPEKMAERMHEVLKAKNAHLHGVYIGGSAIYRSRPTEKNVTDDQKYHVKYLKEPDFATFKWLVLESLGRFPRYAENCTPALDRYYEKKPDWLKYPPSTTGADDGDGADSGYP